MARSANIYTGDGATTNFAVNFTLGFISRSDVVAYVEGELDGSLNQVYRTIVWINDGLITLSPAPSDTKTVWIRRKMDKTILQHDFQDGAIQNETSLDESNLQLLYIIHEILDGFYNVSALDLAELLLTVKDNSLMDTYTELRGQSVGYATVGGRDALGDGGGGVFYWNSSNLSTEVSADPQEGIYVAPTSGPTGASGAWVRLFSGAMSTDWFGGDLQAALDIIVAKGTVIIPDGSAVTLTAGVTCEEKDITLIIDGIIRDEVVTFTKNYTTLDVNNKGSICFMGGELTVIGNGHLSLYGGSGVAGVSQSHRPFIICIQLDRCSFSGLVGENGIGNGYISTYHCDNITHNDGFYTGAAFAVLHSSADNCNCHNLQFLDCENGGLTVHNRGDFATGVLAHDRSTNVRFSDCSAIGTFATNAAAVGITCDSSDHVLVTNCISDNQGLGSMAFSWAATTDITVTGCISRNCNNTAVGTMTYAGIGMECDDVVNGVFHSNIFEEVIVGYLMVRCTNVSFQGVYSNVLAKTTNLNTGAAASAGLLNSAYNGLGANYNCDISGLVDGANRSVYLAADHYGLTIHDLVIRENNLDDCIQAGVKICHDLTINNISMNWSGAPFRGMFLYGPNMSGKLSITNIKATAGTLATKVVIDINTNDDVYAKEILIKNVMAHNFKTGIGAFYLEETTAVLDRIMMTSDAGTLIEADIGSLAENSSGKYSRVNCTFEGKVAQFRGSNSPTILQGNTPTVTGIIPMFVGQFYTDASGQKLYYAKGTTAVTDWVLLN